MEQGLYLILLMVLSIFLVVMDRRLPIEKRLRRKYGIDREYWVPVIALVTGLAISLVEFASLRTAFIERIGVIALIFSFGVMSAGLGKSGFFRFIAYRGVEKSKGNTKRLLLTMFVATSAVTFFTTNDIVVLLLTPIMIEICHEAEIENGKLLLLGQFIAANTLSMGLMIGSPTNIIVAETVGLDFFQYMLIMALPALTSFLASLGVLYLSIKASKTSLPFFRDLEFKETYNIPEENPEPDFTAQMRDWLLIFAFFVATVAVTTYMDISLLYSAIPAIIISLTYWQLSDKHTKSVKRPLKQLPYGIFFFGMSFFTFAQQFSKTGLLNQKLVPLFQANLDSFLAPVYSTAFSGLMVNTFNDLPASALIAQTIPKLEMAESVRIITLQSTLTGLNVGTYLTPVGALAGLIWFNEMRKENRKREREVEIPKRTDLIKYGAFNFTAVTLLTGTVLILEKIALQALL
ncbi:MAG: SLC13 family permease [Candidatus Nanohalobium sp.]